MDNPSDADNNKDDQSSQSGNIQKLKSTMVKFKNSAVRKIRDAKSWTKKYRWKIFIILLVFAIIALVVSLVMNSFQGVDISNQAVSINYAEQRILQGQYSNSIVMIGLASQLFPVPKRKFLIYFGTNQGIESKIKGREINARVIEGTKLTVEARVSCQIITSNLHLFLEEYGLNWEKYVIGKSRNVITQVISQIKFYDLTNSMVIEKANTQFNSYRGGDYPFYFELIGVTLNYPKDSFSANNTLGTNLLAANSLLSQLTTNYQLLNSKISASLSNLTQIASKLGSLNGEIQKQKLQMTAIQKNWVRGLQDLSSIYANNEAGLRQFMWLYFQNMYNSTYLIAKNQRTMV